MGSNNRGKHAVTSHSHDTTSTTHIHKAHNTRTQQFWPMCSTELSALLKTNGVDERVISWLGEPAQSIRTLKNFANCVDSRSEVKATLLDKTPLKDSVGQLAALKQAWREADGIASIQLKRSAEGLSEETIDEPLPHELHKSVMSVFRLYYRFDLKVEKIGTDSLIGRFKREFDKRQPTMYAFLKAKSLCTTLL